MNQSNHRSHQQIDNIIADVTASIVKPTLTREQEIVQKANAITKEVHSEFIGMHKLRPLPMSKAEAAVHIAELYKAKYNSWSKEELLENLAMLQAAYHSESYHDFLT